MKVFVVEPDLAASEVVESMLKSVDAVVRHENEGHQAIEQIKTFQHDIILTEIMLPDMSGFDLIRDIRDAHIRVPIVVITGVSSPDVHVRALDSGADVFLTKPFNKDVLIANIRACIRRYRGFASSIIEAGDLSIDLCDRQVRIKGVPVNLTDTESRYVEILLLRQGTTVSKETMLDHIYGGIDEPDIKSIDVYVSKIRKKLANASDGMEFIETVWGRGYTIPKPAPNTD